jgi:hypothetical protein
MVRRLVYLCGVAAVLLCTACTAKETFLNVAHRQNYEIQVADFSDLQFYISTEILAKDASSTGGTAADNVVFLPEGTPGVAVQVEPSWIRVSFEEGGSGAVFLTDTTQRDDGYWLATQVPGEAGYRRVLDLEDPMLHAGGRIFRVVYGAGAYLLVDKDDLEKLVSRRRHLKGRKK